MVTMAILNLFAHRMHHMHRCNRRKRALPDLGHSVLKKIATGQQKIVSGQHAIAI